jgi:hypothetical protein
MARKPTERQLKALWNIHKAENGQPTFVNRDDGEECEDLGWDEAQPGSGYCLTDEGRRILREDPE